MPCLQAELAHSGQLVVGGRSSVHFDPENLSDLHGGGCRLRRRRRESGRANRRALVRADEQAGFPVSEIGGEENLPERPRPLFGGPIFRDRAKRGCDAHGCFRESGPLRVSPSPRRRVASVLLVNSWPANSRPAVSGGLGVLAYPPAHGHQVGKVQAAPLPLSPETCSGVGLRVGDLLQFENIGDRRNE